MSKKLFLIFSHKLSEDQIEQAKNELNIVEFVSLPEDIQKIWSNIDPGVEDISSTVDGIYNYIIDEASKEDMILVQGEMGSTFYLVTKLKKANYTCIYSTTKRLVEEFEENGQIVKKSYFKHVRFRRY